METSAQVAGGIQRRQNLPAGQNSSGFVRSVFALLERTEYRRCESGEDMEAIARLRYRAYRSHGFVPETPDQVTQDEYDEIPNCYRFGVFVDGQMLSTVRLHHITRENSGGPIMKAFGDVLMPRIERGNTFINPTLFAADPDLHANHRALPYVTLRLAVLANAYFASTSCVCVIREEHTGFYRRIFGSSQVGVPRSYPPFSVPVMLYASECAENLQSTLRRFPFFQATAAEKRMLFSKFPTGEVRPLTILPTAKYLAEAA